MGDEPQTPQTAPPSADELAQILDMPDRSFRLRVYSDIHKIVNLLGIQSGAMTTIAESSRHLRDAVTGGDASPEKGLRYAIQTLQDSVNALKTGQATLGTDLKETNKAWMEAVAELRNAVSKGRAETKDVLLKAAVWILGLTAGGVVTVAAGVTVAKFLK